MNTNTSPSSQKQEVTHLEKLRSQISTDIEDIQQKESSLREYEQRLRVLVEHAHNTRPPQATSAPPLPAVVSLDAEWEKYRRAHSLLEAARRGLCDDRMALRDREEKLQQREDEVSRREAWVKVREQEIEVQARARAEELAKPAVQPKRKTSFTVAPFLAARNLLLRHN